LNSVLRLRTQVIFGKCCSHAHSQQAGPKENCEDECSYDCGIHYCSLVNEFVTLSVIRKGSHQTKSFGSRSQRSGIGQRGGYCALKRTRPSRGSPDSFPSAP